MKKILLFIVASLCVMLSHAQQTENRVALVIGNSTYKTSPLKNPVNDAADMSARLKGFGFTVIERNNLTTKQIGSTLREFRSKLTPGSVALVFYAGHGVTIKGKNYLPAVDAEINGEEDVPNQSLGTEQIMDVLAEAKTRLNLVFLDACRDNPYARSFRSTSRGLSRESAPSGTLISFATKPGSVAADGTGRNGLYTSVLLEQLKNSNQPIEQVLKKVVSGVRVASKSQQEPWMEGSIEGDFCFSKCSNSPENSFQISSIDQEEKFWEDSKSIGTKEGYEAYLFQFPKGRFAGLAKAQISKLMNTSPPSTAISSVGMNQNSVPQVEVSPTPALKPNNSHNIGVPLTNQPNQLPSTKISALITGAGATYPFPAYLKWAEGYKAITGTTVNYQSIGSSAGIRQIKAKTVTFGATDAPLRAEDLDNSGLIQFPTIFGATVPVINLDSFKSGELQLTGNVLSEIFIGRITNWNDSKIAVLNPSKKLPDQAITVVHRADGSGTTFNFTNYLATVSKDWASNVGSGAAVRWPAATSVGGKGNEGVAATVIRIKGSIGYVEYGYFKMNNMNAVQLQNSDGKYVVPDDSTIAAAVSGTDWFSIPGMGVSMVNARGAASWPISFATFILMPKQPIDKFASLEAIKFFDYSFLFGKKMASELSYVPLPETLASAIRAKVWSQIQH